MPMRVITSKEKNCAFTGHRPNKLPWGENEADPACQKLKQAIYDAAEAVYSSGVRHFLCGMALGCDVYFCEAVIRLREEHPDVTLEAAIPWEGQAEGWSAADQARYRRLCENCDYITMVQTHYSPDCMLRRNYYMVDSSSVLIAAYNGSAGGTMRTYLYALRQGLEIIELPIDGK
ncbi:MAG: DUF1273 domain-containing protein [Firmicutes bacterium]|nr:DUF1273 domain-containing protein [Bacillota bacterium]